MSNITWSTEKMGGIGSTDTYPSFAFFNGTSYIGWKGVAGDQRCFFTYMIYVSPSPDGFDEPQWHQQAQIPGISSSTGVSIVGATLGPPLIAREKLYVVFKGSDTDARIFITSFDTLGWTAQSVVSNFATSTAPCLATDGTKLYMAWRGNGTDERCFFATFDGLSWTPQAVIPGALSNASPTLCVTGGVVYVAWKGPDTEQKMWFSSFQNNSWTAKLPMPGLTSTGPSLAKGNPSDGHDSTLMAAWKGQNGDNTVWCTLYAENAWLSPQQVPVARTNTRPDLVTNGTGGLNLVWRQDTDGGLYSMFGGDDNFANQTIPR